MLANFVQGSGQDVDPLVTARGDDRDQDFEVVQAMGESFDHIQVDFRDKANVKHSFLSGYCRNGP